MAVGGQKGGGSKGGKKAGKKKTVDPFTKKEWYDIKAPSMFTKRTCARTLVTRTQGTKIASDALKGRVVTLSLGDLSEKNEEVFRKFKLQIEDVQGRHCLTNFHGLEITRDKLCSIVLKWRSTIEAHVDVKTTDGYHLRFFIISFTPRATRAESRHSYAQASRIKRVRARLVETIQQEVASCDLKEVVNKLIPDSIAQDARKAASWIYPQADTIIRKVKVLKKPKMDLARLMELHGESKESASGEGVMRPDHYEPPQVDSV
ncbi:Small subunit ribosomal protein 1 [Paragonimus heterotremus]|uniref:Small ribosomal subunit protein eS1 n=1 Tax=Paragonimus heterotremus TaxID=100268 RepID=A0A8J4T5S8_9TREM|nr:Small subunit ribosomal protein 1 [Paragonimus heterotremus]